MVEKHFFSTSGSYIPEIVVTPDDESVPLSIANLNIHSRTKSFSLLYDFDGTDSNASPLPKCSEEGPPVSDHSLSHLTIDPESSRSISSVC